MRARKNASSVVVIELGIAMPIQMPTDLYEQSVRGCTLENLLFVLQLHNRNRDVNKNFIFLVNEKRKYTLIFIEIYDIKLYCCSDFEYCSVSRNKYVTRIFFCLHLK